jgi:lysozyme
VRTSQTGQDFIKRYEQCRLKAYKPTPDDVWTIGWGHTEGVYEGLVWTQEMADLAFSFDLEKYETWVSQLVKVALTQGQFDALVSFCFNVGPDIDVDTIAEGLGDSTLLKKLNAGDYEGARAEFKRWDKQKGKTLAGLTKRRQAEAEMFV